jgi:hypothetical protein
MEISNWPRVSSNSHAVFPLAVIEDVLNQRIARAAARAGVANSRNFFD